MSSCIGQLERCTTTASSRREAKKSGKGVWVLLKHQGSNKEMWVGSVRIPVNETVEEVDRRSGGVHECVASHTPRKCDFG